MQFRSKRGLKRWSAWCLAAVVSLLALGAAHAQDIKVGYVNSERILRDSAPARAATQKLEQEFAKRDRELQELGVRLKQQAERFEKDAPVLAEADRNRRQRELAEMDRDLQRRQREFREDLNQRRNEELQSLLERAQRIVRQIAEQEKFDLVVQDAVFFSSRVDITDKVLKALNNGK
jgi:outer membrane protein